MSKNTNNDLRSDGKSAHKLHFLSPPPKSERWIDILHWCLMVLGPHHRDSAISANLLSYVYEHGHLTAKQYQIADRISDWLLAEYRVQLNA